MTNVTCCLFPRIHSKESKRIQKPSNWYQDKLLARKENLNKIKSKSVSSSRTKKCKSVCSMSEVKKTISDETPNSDKFIPHFQIKVDKSCKNKWIARRQNNESICCYASSDSDKEALNKNSAINGDQNLCSITSTYSHFMADQNNDGLEHSNLVKGTEVISGISMASRLSRLIKYKELKERRAAEKLNIPKFPGYLPTFKERRKKIKEMLEEIGSSKSHQNELFVEQRDKVVFENSKIRESMKRLKLCRDLHKAISKNNLNQISNEDQNYSIEPIKDDRKNEDLQLSGVIDSSSRNKDQLHLMRKYNSRRLKNNSHISISELISDCNNSGLRCHQHISYNISSEVRDEPYKNMIVDQEQILVNDRLSLSPIDPSEKQISDDINKLIEILRM